MFRQKKFKNLRNRFFVEKILIKNYAKNKIYAEYFEQSRADVMQHAFCDRQ